MDIVYILGKGSKWDNNEIRYSLRSVEKHLTGYNDIYVIGERPDFLNYKKIKHIPYSDNPLYYRQRRIMDKILVACNNRDISENFLFFNDDHFILQNRDVKEIDFYHSINLKTLFDGTEKNDKYYMSISNTIKVLSSKGLETNNFDIHCPIIYNKELFKKVMNEYDWNLKNGYVVKSLYCNTLGIKGQYLEDCKINCRNYNVGLLKEKPWFSVGDEGLSVTKNIFLEFFPEKSQFES